MGILKLSYQEELVRKKLIAAKNHRKLNVQYIIYSTQSSTEEVKLAYSYIDDLDAERLSFSEWQLTRENLK